jgi:hypothetical protein
MTGRVEPSSALCATPTASTLTSPITNSRRGFLRSEPRFIFEFANLRESIPKPSKTEIAAMCGEHFDAACRARQM